jgi:hypothetical protein
VNADEVQRAAINQEVPGVRDQVSDTGHLAPDTVLEVA